MLPGLLTRRERAGRALSGGVRTDPCRFGAGGFSLPSSVVPPRSARSGALVSRGGPGPRVACSAGRPRARVPGPGNPRPAVKASAGQCDWGPWAAPSGDPGTPRPPWAANPGVSPQPTSAIENQQLISGNNGRLLRVTSWSSLTSHARVLVPREAEPERAIGRDQNRGAGNNGPVSTLTASSFLNCPGVRCGPGWSSACRNGLSVYAARWLVSPRRYRSAW